MTEVVEMTREGKEQLEEELDHLVSVTRKENAERLKVAISYGDLSENAEYDAAKEAQAETEQRIAELENMLRTAKVVGDDDLADDVAGIGRKVTVKNILTNEEEAYTIVGITEADPFSGKISKDSPVGSNLDGHKVGDLVEFTTPGGDVKYEVMKIEKA
ncbi:transcription elongation factor GreA [Mobilibacterium timonense]|uniref:transcription elongation factor GreA n=1 Tax=Mobilibacterium timonense TaxID=1871012 RepID=UPI00098481B4|nr:transcription elongation factor GreA [Mobilibacterium timonense]MBM6989854.1 transcription elongation factor GreA [Mobilibacterium timonense]